MNIGIDATCWWNNRGFGRFTRELLTALFELDTNHHYTLFTDQPIPVVSRFNNVSIIHVNASRPTTEAAVADSNRSPFDMLRLYRAVARERLDLMYFPAVYSWFPAPLRLPTVVTLHDAIAEHYPKLIFASWRSRFFWAVKVKLAIWNSDRILTVSAAAKQEIVDYIGARADIIDVASEAPNPLFRKTTDHAFIAAARARAGLPEKAPTIVYVGGLAPHKNLHGLLDGFERANSHGHAQNVHMALVGDFEGAGFLSNYSSLWKRVEANEELRDRVHFTGYISDEDLVALYSSATAVAMPSYSEGFGLPAIEAMSCATPVLSSNLGSLPEVVGDAGLYFDPFDVDAIAQSIIEIVENTDLRETLSANALARAPQFTWRRSAELALAHLERLCES
ncbi:MAG: glycosyltransferase family 1 protein [Halioglobus sp.]|nr:glycosyltransferase family 1 protein [Halioglobus sp.]